MAKKELIPTDAKYKIGDVVQLRSGGAEMTVCAVSVTIKYYCMWQNNRTGKVETILVPEDALRLIFTFAAS